MAEMTDEEAGKIIASVVMAEIAAKLEAERHPRGALDPRFPFVVIPFPYEALGVESPGGGAP